MERPKACNSAAEPARDNRPRESRIIVKQRKIQRQWHHIPIKNPASTHKSQRKSQGGRAGAHFSAAGLAS